MNPVNKQWPSKHIRGVHPYPACGHLLEKESSGRWGVLSPARRDSRGRLGTAVPTPSLAKSQAPKGRHAIAWGGSPGSDGPKKHKPRRGGTIQYTVPAAFRSVPKRCRKPHSKTLTRKLPVPFLRLVKRLPMAFTLIRPAATFSLMEKESSRLHLAKRRERCDTLSQRERAGEMENAL